MMCLAVPAVIKSIAGLRAVVETLGCQEEVDIRLIPDAYVGDYVLVHVGFAVKKLELLEAEEMLAVWHQALSSTMGEAVD